MLSWQTKFFGPPHGCQPPAPPCRWHSSEYRPCSSSLTGMRYGYYIVTLLYPLRLGLAILQVQLILEWSAGQNTGSPMQLRSVKTTYPTTTYFKYIGPLGQDDTDQYHTSNVRLSTSAVEYKGCEHHTIIRRYCCTNSGNTRYISARNVSGAASGIARGASEPTVQIDHTLRGGKPTDDYAYLPVHGWAGERDQEADESDICVAARITSRWFPSKPQWSSLGKFAVLRKITRLPRQVILYVGLPPDFIK
ncbi:hypothetical protein GGR56DRAFT_303487 [Xylariaceae sp. FL0804]|nr:hypothetical protein GGR56DRAFT_303487 [Xylariaceae sp. FL0804]